MLFLFPRIPDSLCNYYRDVYIHIIGVIVENWHIGNQIRLCLIEILKFISHYLALVMVNCCIVLHILLSLRLLLSAILYLNSIYYFQQQSCSFSLTFGFKIHQQELGNKTILMCLYWFFWNVNYLTLRNDILNFYCAAGS